jgi:hypothetical protein
VSCFTLGIIILLMETINGLYQTPTPWMQHRAHTHWARTDDNQAINTFIDNSLGSGHPFAPTIPYDSFFFYQTTPTDNLPLHLGGEFNIFGPPRSDTDRQPPPPQRGPTGLHRTRFSEKKTKKPTKKQDGIFYLSRARILRITRVSMRVDLWVGTAKPEIAQQNQWWMADKPPPLVARPSGSSG